MIFLFDDIVPLKSFNFLPNFDLIAKITSLCIDKRIKSKSTSEYLCLLKIAPVDDQRIKIIANCTIEYSNLILAIDQWDLGIKIEENYALVVGEIVKFRNVKFGTFHGNINREYLVFKCERMEVLNDSSSQKSIAIKEAIENRQLFPSQSAEQLRLQQNLVALDKLFFEEIGMINYTGKITRVISKDLGIYEVDETVLLLTFGLLQIKAFDENDSIMAKFIHPFKISFADNRSKVCNPFLYNLKGNLCRNESELLSSSISSGIKFIFVACKCTAVLGGSISKNKQMIEFHNSLASLCNSSLIAQNINIWKRIQKWSPVFSTNIEKSQQIMQCIYLKFLQRGGSKRKKNFGFNSLIDHVGECYLSSLDRAVEITSDEIANEYMEREHCLGSFMLSDDSMIGFIDVDLNNQLSIFDCTRKFCLNLASQNSEFLDILGSLCIFVDFELIRNSFNSKYLIKTNALPIVVASFSHQNPIIKNHYIVKNIYPLHRREKDKCMQFFTEVIDIVSKKPILCRFYGKACILVEFLKENQCITIFDMDVIENIIQVSLPKIAINSLAVEAHPLNYELTQNKQYQWIQIEPSSLFGIRKKDFLLEYFYAVVIDIYFVCSDQSEVYLILRDIASTNSMSLSVNLEMFSLPICMVKNEICLFKKIIFNYESYFSKLKFAQFSNIQNFHPMPNKPHSTVIVNEMSLDCFCKHPFPSSIFCCYIIVDSIESLEWNKTSIPVECSGCQKQNCTYCFEKGNFYLKLVLNGHDSSSSCKLILDDYYLLSHLFGDLNDCFVDMNETRTKLHNLFTSILYFYCTLHLLEAVVPNTKRNFSTSNITYPTKSPPELTFFILSIQKHR